MTEATDAPCDGELTFVSRSERETIALGETAGRALAPGDLVLLTGELGTGKTRFVEGLARGIDAPSETRSPTFVLVNEYNGRVKLAHCDLYRLGDSDDIGELGLDDYPAQGAAVAVEWPDRAPGYFGPDALRLQLEFGPAPDDRVIAACARGGAAMRLLSAMKAHPALRPGGTAR